MKRRMTKAERDLEEKLEREFAERDAHEQRMGAIEWEHTGKRITNPWQMKAILDHAERLAEAFKTPGPHRREALQYTPPDEMFSGPRELWRKLVFSVVEGRERKFLSSLADQIEAERLLRKVPAGGLQAFLWALHFSDLKGGAPQPQQIREFTFAEIHLRAGSKGLYFGTDQGLRYHLKKLGIRWLKGKPGRRPRAASKRR